MKNADRTPKASPKAAGAAPELSETQREAVFRDARAIAVSAAAGSGKTRVLVERFARLVTRRGIPPERIIAITYTQKAADELRERIERRLAADGHGLLNGREPSIGTIHGFCLRLLQENAVDAGLDPDFGVLQGDLYEGVLDEVADETLDDVMRDRPDDFGPVLEYSDPPSLKAALISAYNRTRTLGRPVSAAVCPDEKALRARVNGWIADIGRWREELPAKLADRLTDIPRADGAWEEWLETLPAILPAIKMNGRTKAHAEEARGYADELEALIAAVADAAAGPYNLRFAELLQRFSSAVAFRKRTGSWVDLHDLLDRVIDLLERPAFRARMLQDYAALFIDEYQDVNPLQAKLLERLGEGLEVFIVGDARQAIYGFRYAESEFFVRRLEAAQAQGDRVEIPENYRSRAGVIDWINALYTGIGDGGFGSLVARRPEGPEADRPSPAVRILWTLPNAEERSSADELRASDAEHAASEIRRMTACGEASLGGTALLLRGMTALPVYEEALRRHGIPYHVTRGRGFYEKSEIVDLLNLFRALQDPDEPLFAAALLRSPFAGLTDGDLWKIFKRPLAASEGPEAPLPLKARIAAAIADDAEPPLRTALEAFWAWFGPLAEVRTELTLSQILERALKSSPFEAVTLTQEDGTRRYANIRKFKDALREFEGLYGSNLDAFVVQLESRMDWRADDEETEAPVAAERDQAVRIMTVHASKGLEFDTVVLGDISNTAPRSRREGVFMITDAARVVSCPPDPSQEGGRVDSASYLDHQAGRARKDADESLRLLYVAATRARERLVLCGSLPVKARKADAPRSWTDRVLEAFPASAEGPGCQESGGVRYEVCHRSMDRTGPAADDGPAPGHAGPDAAAVPDKVTADEILAALEDRSKPYRQTVDLSVSELTGADAEEDGDERSGREMVFLDRGQEGSLLGAASVGHVFHEMLQHIAYDRDPELERARILKDFGHRMDAAAARQFEPALERFLDSPLAQELRASEQAGRPIHRELPFFYRVRKDGRELGSVKGQVDLIFEAPDGKWTLVDYKTTQEQKPEHHRQMVLYAYCLKKLLKGRPHRAVIYYTRTGDRVPVDLDALDGEAFERDLVDRFEKISEEVLRRAGDPGEG